MVRLVLQPEVQPIVEQEAEEEDLAGSGTEQTRAVRHISSLLAVEQEAEEEWMMQLKQEAEEAEEAEQMEATVLPVKIFLLHGEI